MPNDSEATLLLKIKASGEQVLTKTTAAFGTLGRNLAAAFAAVSGAAAATLVAYREQERATNELNQALITQGIYTRELSDHYVKMADELSRVTMFGDEAIVSAEAQIQAYLGQTKITKDLLRATLDFAQVKRIDLASAAEIVGKAIGTNTNALARYGVEVDKNADKSDKMAAVVAQLSGKWDGQAEAATKGLGSLSLMKNALGELLEVVGEKLAPAVEVAAGAVTTLARKLVDSKAATDALDFAIGIVLKVFADMKLRLLTIKDLVVGVVTAIVGAVKHLMAGQWDLALSTMLEAFKTTTTNVGKRYQDFLKDIEEIDNRHAEDARRRREQDVRDEEESEQRKLDIDKKAAADTAEFLKARSDDELVKEIVHQRLKNDAHIKALNDRMRREKGTTGELEAEMEKRNYLDARYAQERRNRSDSVHKFLNDLGIKETDKFVDTLNVMGGMQNSKIKELAIVGKGAALANIAVNTAQGSVAAYSALAGIPIVGPGLGLAASLAIGAHGLERSAEVAGIQLAEGGIVKARPGGVRAIIGEGGRDEAVIPLEDGQPVLGTTVQIVVYGGMLGSESDAREFAINLDRQLFKLRQSNESMAFDRGVV